MKVGEQRVGDKVYELDDSTNPIRGFTVKQTHFFNNCESDDVNNFE